MSGAGGKRINFKKSKKRKKQQKAMKQKTKLQWR